MSSRFHLLHTGYVGQGVASTVSLLLDGDQVILVDPGMVSAPAAILEPLAAQGLAPDDVTDVVLSHHHPDHTMNVGWFTSARVHDHWATYEGDQWRNRSAEGFRVSPSVRLLATPGHTAEDITTLAVTSEGVVAFTHLWWSAEGPATDPRAEQPDLLPQGRARVLELADLVVPGHGHPFVPSESTPV